MADLKTSVREMASQLEAKKSEAAAARTELKTLMESAKKEGVDFASNADAFEKIDAAGKRYDSIKDDVAQLEGKRSRLLEIIASEAGEGPAAAAKADERAARTFGEAFVKSDAYKAARDRVLQGGSIPLGTTDGVKVMDREQTKTLVSVTTASGTPALSGVPVEDRTGLIVGKPLAGLDFLNVINTATTDSDVVEWLEETTYTNSAAETAEYTDSPESAVAFTVRSTNVLEVPHFIPVTRRALADAAFVESWINNRLIDGVRRRLQTQVLGGGGSGDFQGIYGTSGIGSVDRSSTGLSMVDSLHRCITTVRTNAFADPDFIGIHPEDYEAIRLIREETSTVSGGSAVAGKGGYIFGAPSAAAPATLWGVPVIVHSAFTSGTPLVGIGREATLFVREGLSVSASDSHASYFTERKVALLATMRAAFAVTQPKAFAKSVA